MTYHNLFEIQVHNGHDGPFILIRKYLKKNHHWLFTFFFTIIHQFKEAIGGYLGNYWKGLLDPINTFYKISV